MYMYSPDYVKFTKKLLAEGQSNILVLLRKLIILLGRVLHG